MIKKLLTVVVILGCSLFAAAQNLSAEQYIEQYKDLAIREMKRMGVPAAITLAQGLLETESGNSVLLKKSNNHFGIKCKTNWTGNGVSHDDDATGECFRTYKDAEDSYRDHSNFLRGNDRYAFLFKLNPADYKSWAYGLKKAGYATNPKYPAILIRHIEQYNLQQYTEIALTPAESTVAVNSVKCIVAKKGTSLLAIATLYDIQLSKLLHYNDMEQDGLLDHDQLIFLEKKSTKGASEYYITKPGERLLDIAQKNGIQLQSLLEYNQLDKFAVIEPGTKLYLQNAASQSTVTTQPATAMKYHTVQSKEGLYTISKKYGITVQQIKDWNNLTSNNLSVGQQLIVAK
jgi:LysM repeat protein